MMTKKYRLIDNWHSHPRQDELQKILMKYFNVYGRVMCMGNTSPLVETVYDALDYRKEIILSGAEFEPVMCIMLTQDTTVKMINDAFKSGVGFVKFIPIGTSTGAVKGLRIDDYDSLYKIFPAIVENGMYFLVHAEKMIESNGETISLLEREDRAIDVIRKYRADFPNLNITIEHASTKKMIEMIYSEDSRYMGATLTPQHAILNYRDVFGDNNKLINPYNYCLPVAKSEEDVLAVIKAMISGNKRFYYGPDSAGHLKAAKESKNPPAGIFFGSAEIPLLHEIFEKHHALDRFEDFTSRFGAEYYGFQLNTGTITMVKDEWVSPIEEDGIRFCMGGKKYRWKIGDINR